MDPENANAPRSTGRNATSQGAALEHPQHSSAPGWKGLPADVLAEAGIRSGKRTTIPYRWPDGAVHNVRLFERDRTWWRTRGLDMIPFGLDLLPDRATADSCAVVVAEGESDTLAIRAALADPRHGVRHFVIGLPGAQTWRPDWAKYLEPFSLVYVIGDGDQAGRRMAWHVHADVRWARPVTLPDGDDARSLIQRIGPSALEPYLAGADWQARAWQALLKAESPEDWRDLREGRQ